MTFIVYLTDGFDGGETTFYMRKGEIKVIPVQGTALVFYHGGIQWALVLYLFSNL